MIQTKNYGIGLMHEFAVAAAIAGLTPEEISFFITNKKEMVKLCGIVRGTHKIEHIPDMVDCSTTPFAPAGWKIESHLTFGSVNLKNIKAELYQSNSQRLGRHSSGGILYREIGRSKKIPFSANILDHYLANQDLIPKEWQSLAKSPEIIFWGTIIKDKDGRHYVPLMKYIYGKWVWQCCTKDDHFYSSEYAICFKDK
jgi:hypothetical protein